MKNYRSLYYKNWPTLIYLGGNFDCHDNVKPQTLFFINIPLALGAFPMSNTLFYFASRFTKACASSVFCCQIALPVIFFSFDYQFSKQKLFHCYTKLIILRWAPKGDNIRLERNKIDHTRSVQ